MNVEEMIKRIRLRPGMFVGEIKLSHIEQFIGGFRYNNTISGRDEDIDVYFRSEFYDWTLQWLKKNYCEVDRIGSTCTIRIKQVVPDEKGAIDVFFKICDEFFAEYHEIKKQK